MKVLRIETHAHGEGPYQLDLGGSTSRDQVHRPSPEKDIPGWQDQIGFGSREHLFGFLDREQLLRWWCEKEVRDMLRDGMLQISVYEVEDHKVLAGVCQIAFDSRCATYLGRDRPTGEVIA